MSPHRDQRDTPPGKLRVFANWKCCNFANRNLWFSLIFHSQYNLLCEIITRYLWIFSPVDPKWPKHVWPLIIDASPFVRSQSSSPWEPLRERSPKRPPAPGQYGSNPLGVPDEKKIPSIRDCHHRNIWVLGTRMISWRYLRYEKVEMEWNRDMFDVCHHGSLSYPRLTGCGESLRPIPKNITE